MYIRVHPKSKGTPHRKSFVPHNYLFCATKREERMARPTENRKDKTVKLRINTELYEEISSLGENISETIRDLIKKGLDSFVPQNSEEKEGFVPQNKDDYVPQNFISDETREDIEKMCHLCGISTKLFFDEVDRLFNEGKLEVDCMKIRSNGEYYLADLENACHLANRDVQEAIDNTVDQVMRGRR